MTADLSALIARLEAAEAGSRELDDAAWFAATGEKASYPFDDETDPHIRYGTLAWVRLPRSTTSLDAALALAERVLPGWVWNMGNDTRCWAHLWNDLPTYDGNPSMGRAATPAVALCNAILRAKQGEGE